MGKKSLLTRLFCSCMQQYFFHCDKKVYSVVTRSLCAISCFLLLSICSAEEAALKLTTDDGSTKFIIQDKNEFIVHSIDSDGNVIVRGTMTVQGDAFSVAGSTLVVRHGNVGIGTAGPTRRLSIVDPGVGLDRPAANVLGFYTADTERMRIDSAGNVGIGTTAPAAKLDVRSGLSGVGTFALRISTSTDGAGTSVMCFRNDGNVGIGTTAPTSPLTVARGPVQITGKGTPTGGAGLELEGDSSCSEVMSINRGAGGVFLPLRIRGSAITLAPITDPSCIVGIGATASDVALLVRSTTAFRVDTGGISGTEVVVSTLGNVGIGIATPAHPLHMGSGAHCTVGGVWTNASSREYKENIREISTEEAIAVLVKLNPVKFNYKSDKEEECLGFIGEEVPDLVAMKDRKGLSAMDIVAILTKVVQAQQQKISALEKEIKELKKTRN